MKVILCELDHARLTLHPLSAAERKKLKRRAAKTSEDVSDHDSRSPPSGSEDDPNTALVAYQQNPDLAAMLRTFPAITELPSASTSVADSGGGSGGGNSGLWETDMHGMGSAFGGMQLSRGVAPPLTHQVCKHHQPLE